MAWDALAGPAGEALLAAVAADPDGDPLARADRLRRGAPPDLVAAAETLVALRRRARVKFRLADRLWLTRSGLEQASSDRTAALHARRYDGLGHVADLCTGIGGDAMAIGRGRRVTAVEADPVHAEAAGRNARVAGADVGVVLGDATATALHGVEGIFVDPARRTGAGRLRAGTSLPPLSWCTGLAARVPAVGIKAAPGLPLDLVPAGWEVEFVSEGRELKEALLWSPALARGTSSLGRGPGTSGLERQPGWGGVRRASLVDAGAVHELVAGGAPPAPAGLPGAWLVDPDPAVTRAGAVADLAARLGARQLDDRIAFLTLDDRPVTPFGRVLAVAASLPWNLKALRAELRRLDVGSVQVRKRGSAVDVDDLRRRLRLEGSRAATVVLTRLADRPWALVCWDQPD